MLALGRVEGVDVKLLTGFKVWTSALHGRNARDLSQPAVSPDQEQLLPLRQQAVRQRIKPGNRTKGKVLTLLELTSFVLYPTPGLFLTKLSRLFVVQRV